MTTDLLLPGKEPVPLEKLLIIGYVAFVEITIMSFSSS
jgi:hypothetical protein